LRLAAADPHQVLSRGYAWLADGTGRPVTRSAGLQVGTELTAQWADGRAAVQVLGVTPGLAEPPAVDPVAVTPVRASRRRARP
jgi:exodeoxyribonuclease VII large subunit